MPELIPVTDASDERLTDYTGLTDMALRLKHEVVEGLFMAESEKVVRRALAAGYRMRSLLVSTRVEDTMQELIDSVPDDVPVYMGTPEILRSLTGFNMHRGVLAAMHRKPLPSVAEVLAGAKNVAVLEHIVDPTNLGAVYRSAAALGIDAVLISDTCVDPLYRRAVRVSMGAVFTVPYARVEPWPSGLEAVRAAGFEILAMTPAEGSVPLKEAIADESKRYAVMFGTEGTGLTDQAMERAHGKVMIPMSNGVDSLNIAASAAVTFYALNS